MNFTTTKIIPQARGISKGMQYYGNGGIWAKLRPAFRGRSIRSRFNHNLALTREVPDSFPNSISKFAQVEDTINVTVAKSQHDQYVSLLRSKLPTLELPALENHPDSVFVEDTVVAFRKRAVITCPGHVLRQGEVNSIQKILKQLGMDVWDMREKDPSALCDGGDVLNTGRHMFVGLSDRTNRAGAHILEEAFGGYSFPVISVQLKSSDALHLKSIVTHLDEKTLLVPEGDLGSRVIKEMKAEDLGYEVVLLPDISACNVVTVNDALVLASDSICDESRQRLEEAATARSLDLRFVGTTEVAKSDGALTCCSVLLSL